MAALVANPVVHPSSRWYALYTRSRHEKCVAGQLQASCVEHLLPVYETVRHWKNHRVRLSLPLFPGYLFVRIVLADQLQVLKLPGAVRLVGFNGRPAEIGECEIEALRTFLVSGLRAEPHPFLKAGQRVRVRHGPFAGWEGVVVRTRRDFRVVLSLDLILRSIIVDLDAADLEWLPPQPRLL